MLVDFFFRMAEKTTLFFSTMGSTAAEASASLALTHDLSTVSLPMISDQNMPESEEFSFQAVSENEIKRIQARRRGGSKGSNEPPLKFDNGGLKYK